MARTPLPLIPPVSLGLTAATLGSIGFILFMLPVLAAPIAGCGVLLALIGIAEARFARKAEFRVALAGLTISCLALATAWAVGHASLGFEPAPAFRASGSRPGEFRLSCHRFCHSNVILYKKRAVPVGIRSSAMPKSHLDCAN